MDDPAKTIIVSLLVTGGILTWRGVSQGTLTPRTYAALVVVALMLIALGSFAPDLAAAFAVLVMAVVLLSRGKDLESLARIGGRR